ncbi:hypothetical protein [Flexibacterium corallicola]|uniref:hypothetical protein n=1 Tax=Flexibacterium corallicola TaxID=3037259 RepID=UPI00286F9FC8|nr:hypothetical protein [Pseudovibrio sp. M1P-2-3]
MLYPFNATIPVHTASWDTLPVCDLNVLAAVRPYLDKDNTAYIEGHETEFYIPFSSGPSISPRFIVEHGGKQYARVDSSQQENHWLTNKLTTALEDHEDNISDMAIQSGEALVWSDEHDHYIPFSQLTVEQKDAA